MSDKPITLVEALAILQTRLPHIGKDQAAIIQPKEGGRVYGYKYADLATVSKLILPELAKLGVAFVCRPTLNDDGKFVLAYALAKGEEELGGFYPLPSGTPQQVGSAITYARRYALCALTGAAPDEDDDDGEAASRSDGLPVNRDGSLSRSRTSDDEKAAAGVMTDAQNRAHGQLAKPPPNAGPVERLGTISGPSVEDPWMDGPAGLAPEDDPEDRPGSIATEQVQILKGLYGQLGIKDRAKQLQVTAGTLKIDVLPTHLRLSFRQAGDLILALRAQAKAEASG